MPGDHDVRCAFRLKATHRSRLTPELAVVGLDRVVLVLLEVLPCREEPVHQALRIKRRGVGDDFGARHLERPQCPGGEPAQATASRRAREEHVDYPGRVGGHGRRGTRPRRLWTWVATATAVH